MNPNHAEHRNRSIRRLPGVGRGHGLRAHYRRLALILVAVVAACSSAPHLPEPERIAPTPFRLVPDHERYVVPGEDLEYSVDVLIMKVGVLKYRTRSAEDAGAGLLAIDSISAPTGIAAALSRYGGRSTSWIDRSRMRTERYMFAATTTDPPKRRYDELLPGGRLAGTEIWGESWMHRSFDVDWALDPTSLQFLLRVIDLDLDETVRLDLFEGHNRRLVTIRGGGRAELTVKGVDVPTAVFEVRVDKVEDGELAEDEPEMDVRVWVSEDDRRVVLKTRGRLSGVSATIRLVRRTVAEAGSAGEPEAARGTDSRGDEVKRRRAGPSGDPRQR